MRTVLIEFFLMTFVTQVGADDAQAF